MRVKPKRVRLRGRHAARRVVIRVDAPGELVGAPKIKICAHGARGRVNVGHKRCKGAGRLRPGRHVHRSFKVKLARGGRHRRSTIRFVAGGSMLRAGSTTLRIAGR